MGVVGRVEEADVLVHVVDEDGRQALDVLVHVDDVLDGAVARAVEDRVVDEDAVDAVVGVGLADGFLELFALDLAQAECKATFVVVPMSAQCVLFLPFFSLPALLVLA